jgi:hypothetical protein
MHYSGVADVIKNIGAAGLDSKYNSGSLTPMGLNGPTANPFLSIPEPGAEYLAPVIKGGMRKARFSAKRRHRSRRRSRRHNKRK